MKSILIILIIFAFCSGCERTIEIDDHKLKSTLPSVLSQDFLDVHDRPDFEIIQIDSLANYRQLLNGMHRLSCEDKYIGIQFSYRDTIYGITGFTGCPTAEIISCHFNRNIFLIRNDSLKNLGFNDGKKVHINNLKEEIKKISTSAYRFKFDKSSVDPALIHLFIENKFPITLTKEVLREVIIQFDKISSEKGPDYFKYNVLFEGISMMDIPPPPPPDWEEKK
jgi:hypothetical protein